MTQPFQRVGNLFRIENFEYTIEAEFLEFAIGGVGMYESPNSRSEVSYRLSLCYGDL